MSPVSHAYLILYISNYGQLAIDIVLGVASGIVKNVFSVNYSISDKILQSK